MEKPVDEHREVIAVPAVGNDAEAVATPEGYQYVSIDPVIERSLVRKLDRALMPLLFASCTLLSLCSSCCSQIFMLLSLC